MARLRILTILSVLVAGIIFFTKAKHPTTIAAGEGLQVDKAWLAVNAHPQTPAKDIRPADQTFLTYPEWFLVFSPAEQADYFKEHTASTFPYMKHVNQMWVSYHIVYAQIKDNYTFNTGYHFMIWVICGSTTIEYGIKAVYEKLVGRITKVDGDKCVTDEDRFNAKYMQEYVDFIRVYPWYEFDFTTRLKALWETPMTGDHFVRKLERKYFLTTELVTKALYGKLIGIGTQSVYGTAAPTTVVVTAPTSVNKLPQQKDIQVISWLPDSSAILSLPRYEAFRTAATELAKSGAQLKEIAGNNGALLLTVITPISWTNTNSHLKTIFTQDIPTRPGYKREALVTTVPELGNVLSYLGGSVMVEHIYDY